MSVSCVPPTQMIDLVVNQGKRYDLFVVDDHFGLGRTRGSAAIHEVRMSMSSTSGRTPVIILCSGGAGNLTEEQLSHLGVDAIWDKPVPNFQDGTMQAQLASLFEQNGYSALVQEHLEVQGTL